MSSIYLHVPDIRYERNIILHDEGEAGMCFNDPSWLHAHTKGMRSLHYQNRVCHIDIRLVYLPPKPIKYSSFKWTDLTFSDL
jgi:hypothetical protein